MNVSQRDREILKELATRYMTYATSEQSNKNRELWRKLNQGTMQKPMITIHQMPWKELDVDGFLVRRVDDPYFRQVEGALRNEIYKWEHMPADMVLNPYVILPRPISNTGFGISTVNTDNDKNAKSHLFVSGFSSRSISYPE